MGKNEKMDIEDAVDYLTILCFFDEYGAHVYEFSIVFYSIIFLFGMSYKSQYLKLDVTKILQNVFSFVEAFIFLVYRIPKVSKPMNHSENRVVARQVIIFSIIAAILGFIYG